MAANIPGTQTANPAQNVGTQIPGGFIVGRSPGGAQGQAQSIPIRAIQPVNIYKAPLKAGSGVTITNNTISSTSGISQLTGDVTAGPGSGSQVATLATVMGSPGTYNNVTVNNKGLTTAGSNVAYLTANQTITLTGYTTGSGTTSIATTTGKVKGNTSGSTPAAGDVGEYLETIVLIASEVNINNAAANVATLSLTAGDWDVWGELWVDLATGTATLSGKIHAVATASSATVPAVPTAHTARATVDSTPLTGAQTTEFAMPTGIADIQLAGTTNVYLVGQATTSAGTAFGYGKICARRRS